MFFWCKWDNNGNRCNYKVEERKIKENVGKEERAAWSTLKPSAKDKGNDWHFSADSGSERS